VEAEGAWGAFVDDLALAVDQVEAVGPAGVLALDGVIDAIDQRGKANAEGPHTAIGDVKALGVGLRIAEDDVVADVAAHLPDVARVGFFDVDGEKGDAVAIFVVELVERGNLPAKGRSGIAAEYQDDGAIAAEGRELNDGLTVEGWEAEIGREVAGVDGAVTGAGPESFEGERDHQRHGGAGDDAAESVGSLAHGPVSAGAENDLGSKRREKDRNDEAAHNTVV